MTKRYEKCNETKVNTNNNRKKESDKENDLPSEDGVQLHSEPMHKSIDHINRELFIECKLNAERCRLEQEGHLKAYIDNFIEEERNYYNKNEDLNWSNPNPSADELTRGEKIIDRFINTTPRDEIIASSLGIAGGKTGDVFSALNETGLGSRVVGASTECTKGVVIDIPQRLFDKYGHNDSFYPDKNGILQPIRVPVSAYPDFIKQQTFPDFHNDGSSLPSSPPSDAGHKNNPEAQQRIQTEHQQNQSENTDSDNNLNNGNFEENTDDKAVEQGWDVFPENDGFVKGTEKPHQLQPGDKFVRWGESDKHPDYYTQNQLGSYAAPDGTSYGGISLKGGEQDRIKYDFEVLNPVDTTSGIAAPYYNQDGGETQYKFPESIDSMWEKGDIKPTGVSFEVDHRNHNESIGSPEDIEKYRNANPDSDDDLNSGTSEENTNDGRGEGDNINNGTGENLNKNHPESTESMSEENIEQSPGETENHSTDSQVEDELESTKSPEDCEVSEEGQKETDQEIVADESQEDNQSEIQGIDIEQAEGECENQEQSDDEEQPADLQVENELENTEPLEDREECEERNEEMDQEMISDDSQEDSQSESTEPLDNIPIEEELESPFLDDSEPMQDGLDDASPIEEVEPATVDEQPVDLNSAPDPIVDTPVDDGPIEVD